MSYKKILLSAILLFSIVSLQASQANGMGNKGKFSPFLINSKKMPHMTKLLKMNWQNKVLNLSAQQKEPLLQIRKRTMKAVMELAPQIKKLEHEIERLTMQRESVKDISEMLDQLAKLKAEASKVHVKCIHDTLSILEQTQVDFLLKK